MTDEPLVEIFRTPSGMCVSCGDVRCLDDLWPVRGDVLQDGQLSHGVCSACVNTVNEISETRVYAQD